MKPPIFSLAETNLMVIYNPGSRLGLLAELGNMMTYLAEDETDLRTLTLSTIEKLQAMTDEDFAKVDLVPDMKEGW